MGQRGQEADHTVGQLCRALLVKHLHGWSYRQTCRELQTDLLVRWFVGYDLQEATLNFVRCSALAFGVPITWLPTIATAPWNRSTRISHDEAAKPQVEVPFALLADVAPQSCTDLLPDACRRLRVLWQQIELDRSLPGLARRPGGGPVRPAQAREASIS